MAQGINAVRDPKRAIIIITHYQRLLNYVTPDHVHVLSEGRIVKSGDRNLALHLEEQGYSWVREETTRRLEDGGRFDMSSAIEHYVSTASSRSHHGCRVQDIGWLKTAAS